jgi:methyl-accepting chemotaxis protein
MSQAWSVRAKLMASALVATLGVVTLAGFNVYSGRTSSQALERVYASNVRSLVQLQKLDGMVREIRFRAAGVLLEMVSVQGSLNHVREVQKELDSVWRGLDRSSGATDDEQRALLAEMESGWGNLVAILARIELAYATNNNRPLVSILDTEWAEVHKTFVKPLEKLMPLKEVEAKAVYEKSVAANALLNRAAFVLAAAVTVLIGAILFFLSRSLSAQLGGEPAYAADIARTIAAGDLTSEIHIEPQDQSSLLYAMKRMQEQLRQTAFLMQQSARFVASASTQISSGNAELSQRTEAQAASLEETASSMEELTSTVKQNAQNARQANQLAASASSVAVKGGEVVAQVVHTMSSINDSSRKIVDIITVIDGIAFQTNILALNAAVEAARAGEQGRSFAVVATEVRTLAQRSAAAAKQIKDLIADSVGKVSDGTRLVDEAGKTMRDIVTSVKRVTDIVAEISVASQEQSSGIEQVNHAVTQMEDATQKNAALAEEASAAARTLQEQAENLAQAVAVFRVDASAGTKTPPLITQVEAA